MTIDHPMPRSAVGLRVARVRDEDARAEQASVASGLNQAAMAAAFTDHGPRLLAYLSRRVSPAEAEDVLAETSCTAWQQRDRFDPSAGQIVGWLFGIATHLLSRHKRSWLRSGSAHARWASVQHSQTSTVIHDLAEDAADRLDAGALRTMLSAGIAKLNEGEREALLLSAWAQLSPTEIAIALRIPAATVRTRLHRARNSLKNRHLPTYLNGSRHD